MVARAQLFAMGSHAFVVFLAEIFAAFAIHRVPLHVPAAVPGMRVPHVCAAVRILHAGHILLVMPMMHVAIVIYPDLFRAVAVAR